MNCFKYLCVLLLSIGAVSSAFAQFSAPSCLPGVYSGEMQFEGSMISPWITSYSDFEMEAVYTPSEAIFLITNEEGEQFCTSYMDPQIISKFSNYYVESSFSPESRGRIGDTSTVFRVFFTSSNCDQMMFKTKDRWVASLFSAKEIEKQPRSFNEIKRICDSLPVQ